MSQNSGSFQETIEEKRGKDDPLTPSLERLRQIFAQDISGNEREWAQSLGNALVQVEAAFRQHRTGAKKPDGVLAEVDETRPTLARQADGVRTDHDDLLIQVVVLRGKVQRANKAFAHGANPYAEIGAIRQQAEQLFAGLEQNRETETKLLEESINTDIGVGD